MNIELLLDRVEHERFNRLAPHLYVMDTQKPFEISGNIKIPGPVMSTICNWINE